MDLYGNLKKIIMKINENTKIREFLQALGTECMRNTLSDNIWVAALMADYKHVDYNDDEQPSLPNWIITDVRFPNEAEAIKARGGIILRVNRPGYAPINAHPSEVGLDAWDFDYRIVNNSDVFDLKVAVENVLKHAKILK